MKRHADVTPVFARKAVKVFFALEWAAAHSSIFLVFVLSLSIHRSPCLPVNLKQKRTEKQTPEGE